MLIVKLQDSSHQVVLGATRQAGAEKTRDTENPGPDQGRARGEEARADGQACAG